MWINNMAAIEKGDWVVLSWDCKREVPPRRDSLMMNVVPMARWQMTVCTMCLMNQRCGVYRPILWQPRTKARLAGKETWQCHRKNHHVEVH